MKKFIILLLLMVLGTMGYYEIRLWKFANASSDYYARLETRLACINGQNVADRNEAWLQRQGLTIDQANEGILKEYGESGRAFFYKHRDMYDTQIPACLEYAKDMCWAYDEDDTNLERKERCSKNFGRNPNDSKESK